MGYFLSILFNFFLVLSVGCCLHIIVTLTGKYFFAFPVIYTVSRYTLVLCQEAGLDPLLAFSIGAVAAILIGFIIALLESRVPQDLFASLGLASIFANISLVESWTSLTNGVLGISGVERPHGFESLQSIVLIGGALAVSTLTLEWIFLKTSLKRKWLGTKEASHLVQSIGISVKKLSLATIVVGSLFVGLAGMPFVWFTRYLDPNMGGLIALLEGLSVAILARQPKVSHVFFSAGFVTVLPEILRFLNLPSAIFGPVRSMLYSILLIALLINLQRKHLNINRQI